MMIDRRRLAFLAASLTMAAAGGVGAVAAPPRPKLQAFDISQVTLDDGLLRTEQEADRKYLHDLDSDRLLYNFRKNAGLPAPGQPLGGWEAPDCELRGHFVGHYLSACALMVRSTGDTPLKAKADAMVAELGKCQQALGGGYLSAFPQSFLDRVEARQQVWAPYYTIHKILAGLVDMYTYCGNRQALQIAENMAAYIKRRSDKLSDDQFDGMLSQEFGGMANVLYDLYAINHRPDDLALAHRFDQQSFLHPLAEDVDDLTNIHANTHIPKVLGAARRYELLGDPPYGHLTGFFWDRIANHRSYATGGSNVFEKWGEPDKLAHTLRQKGWGGNQETCTTYNMLKVTRDLIRWTGDPKYADFYERAYWNGIVEAQNPATGMMIYYTPLGAGAVKDWGTPDQAFWCCYGTGVESFAKLADSIYFHDARDLYVNLYAASTVRWTDHGVSVEQKTAFPAEEASTLIVHARRPVRFALHLRVPSWATGSRITVNGKPSTVAATPGQYAVLDRSWRDGDQVRISLPMALHTQAMPDDPDVQAVLYGPVVLAGLFDDASPYTPYDRTTGLLKETSPDPAAWLTPVAGQPLTFRTTGQDHDTTFIPLYRVIDQPYTVYWSVDRPGSSVAKRLAEAAPAK